MSLDADFRGEYTAIFGLVSYPGRIDMRHCRADRIPMDATGTTTNRFSRYARPFASASTPRAITSTRRMSTEGRNPPDFYPCDRIAVARKGCVVIEGSKRGPIAGRNIAAPGLRVVALLAKMRSR